MPNPTPETPRRATSLRAQGARARRGVYLAAGLLCVGLGAVGVFVPGMPTTIFLIVASFFLVRSSPTLQARLVRSRFFAPYVRYLDGDTPMPRKAKVLAITMMWAMIAASSALLVWRETPAWVVTIVVASGVVGTVAIIRFRGVRRG
ncbi:MAG: YbaN family protein [Planctomycetota bacterium]|nr:YbaN family protein [Planctomycetota bacterium]